MNVDKKWLAIYDERQAEINYLYVYPGLLSFASIVYLLRRRSQNENKAPAVAKM